ncbi:clpP [Symbiodinium microadriaticum]|nr:clpP [Symbiodinium microadriaticum]
MPRPWLRTGRLRGQAKVLTAFGLPARGAPRAGLGSPRLGWKGGSRNASSEQAECPGWPGPAHGQGSRGRRLIALTPVLAGTAGLLAWRSTHALQEQAPAVPKEPEKAPDKAEPSKEPAKEAVKDPAKDAGAGKKTPAARTVNIDQESRFLSDELREKIVIPE